MFNFIKSKKGFTLVELMIVVVIIAILVAVAVPIYRSVTGKAKATTCLDNRRQIKSQISMYYTEHGEDIGNVSGTCTFKTTDGGKTVTFSGDNAIKALFMSTALPCCPANGVITATYSAKDAEGKEALLNVDVTCSLSEHSK